MKTQKNNKKYSEALYSHMYEDDPNDNSDCECDLDPLRTTAAPSPQTAYDKLNVNASHTSGYYPRPEVLSLDNDQGGNVPPTLITPSTLAVVSLGGSVVCLNKIAAGTGVGQILGNQITVKRVSYRLYVTSMSAIVPIRICLVWDKQPNGVVPLFSDIFQDVGVTTASRATVFSHINVNNRNRFILLKDIQIPLLTSVAEYYHLSGSLPIDMSSVYTNLSPTPVIPNTGALLLVSAVQSGATSSTMMGRWRVTYTEN